jgi:DNA-binding Lrp family transcriptional regulator
MNKIFITEREVRVALTLFQSVKETADYLTISESTLRRRFKSLIKLNAFLKMLPPVLSLTVEY